MNSSAARGARTYGSGHLIRRFYPYLKRYRGLLALDLMFAAMTTLCDIALPMIMRRLTNAAMDSAMPLTAAMVLRMAALYVLLRLIDAAANFYMQSQGHIMGVHIETDMRTDAFAHLQRLSDTYYANTKIGQIMGRITNDLFDVTEFSHHCPEEFFIGAIKVTAAFAVLFATSPLLTLLVFACVPVMLVVCTRLNHWLRDAQKAQRFQIGELNAAIEDSLLGQKVVKAFTGEAAEAAKFDAGNQEFRHIKTRWYYAMATFGTTTRLFDGLMYTVVIVAGGLFLVYGKINAGDLVAYILYVSTLIATIRRIVEFAEQFQRGMTGIERFFEIMDAPVDIQDAPDARPLRVTRGEITFDDVSFEYPDDHNRVLRHLNLTIHPGENVALVGPSGGGKTTICNLIPRFYDVTGGAVRIDGQDVRTVTLESLRGAVGIVQQDVFLFSGTVRENIAYGKPDASEEEIVRAAQLAGADDFIRGLPRGYDSYIGERGVTLAGGQKQRLTLARVFLKNPKLLLLDEATSALDNESESLVSQSLERLAKGRTTLTIAHRLTTIRHADRILVLGPNDIEEEGTHEELLAKKGLYYRLWTGEASEESDGARQAPAPGFDGGVAVG
ncbi:MAG: ABC transporter ATP-binding protein [Clostridia bacterium]|nr:ABC transporter ATP-binding protein [Clostridia bacterium]